MKTTVRTILILALTISLAAGTFYSARYVKFLFDSRDPITGIVKVTPESGGGAARTIMEQMIAPDGKVM